MEREVKVLNLDMEKFEQLLVSKGAVLVSEEEQMNININSTKYPIDDNSGYMRIRIAKNILDNSIYREFTFKEQSILKGVRVSKEHNVKIDDENVLIEILKILGYDEFRYGGKYRKSYTYKNARIDLDTWDKETYPYPYAEIEMESEGDLEFFIEDLKLERENISYLSIKELISELHIL